MKRAAVGFGALAGLCSVVALAAATPPAAPGSAAPSGSAVISTAVGPSGVASADPASAAGPASTGGSASQVVSGKVGSTTGISLGGGRPSYRGTEPAMMTVSHSGSQMTVTVTPR